MDLSKLGWDDDFLRDFEKQSDPTHFPGRVCKQEREHYWINTSQAEYIGKISGKFRHEIKSLSEYPAVGDWVSVSGGPSDEFVTIHNVLNRKSKFSRKVAGKVIDEQIIATNIDFIFIVCGLDHDYNLRRIERYLTLAWNSGSIPVILLNKMDLCENVASYILEVESIAPTVAVHAISATLNKGIDFIETYCNKGKTVALIGSSGAGKSTIINTLFNKNLIKTNSVRKEDSRGKHTTTRKELFILPSSGGLIIDTPGLRELQLWSEEEDIKGSFNDVEELAKLCRFKNCRHDSEPHCAIKKAIADGTLDKERFENYLKLQREIVFLESKQNQKLQLIEKNKWKNISILAKEIKRNK